jgi:hypothetical protein
MDLSALLLDRHYTIAIELGDEPGALQALPSDELILCSTAP